LTVILETYLKLEEEFSSSHAKLAAFHDLSKSALGALGLSNELVQWSRQGSVLDQNVKALWLGLREYRDKLAALGLHLEASYRIFEQGYFVASVDKIWSRKLTRSLAATTYLTGYVCRVHAKVY
jgi:hypothetical protein